MAKKPPKPPKMGEKKNLLGNVQWGDTKVDPSGLLDPKKESQKSTETKTESTPAGEQCILPMNEEPSEKVEEEKRPKKKPKRVRTLTGHKGRIRDIILKKKNIFFEGSKCFSEVKTEDFREIGLEPRDANGYIKRMKAQGYFISVESTYGSRTFELDKDFWGVKDPLTLNKAT